MLILESHDDRSSDGDLAWWDRFIPDVFGKVSVGVANMQNETFEETVNNHPDAFGQNEPGGFGPYGLWKQSIDDEKLSIRAAAFRLKDLQSMLPEQFSGTGASYSQEEIAAIGYNVGGRFSSQIARGTYASTNGKASNVAMGDGARSYLNGFRDWWATADQWICGDGVLQC